MDRRYARAMTADELRELVAEAWRMTAAKRTVAAYDAGHPPG